MNYLELLTENDNNLEKIEILEGKLKRFERLERENTMLVSQCNSLQHMIKESLKAAEAGCSIDFFKRLMGKVVLWDDPKFLEFHDLKVLCDFFRHLEAKRLLPETEEMNDKICKMLDLYIIEMKDKYNGNS